MIIIRVYTVYIPVFCYYSIEYGIYPENSTNIPEYTLLSRYIPDITV